MGRKQKYKTEAQREAAKAESKRKWREKQKAAKQAGSTEAAAAPEKKGDGPSWLKKFSRKLEASVSDETPTEAGEPFADLPPVALPGATAADAAPTSPTGEASTESNTESTASDASTPSPSTRSASDGDAPRIEVDNKELAKMAGDMVKGATLAAGAYASERGFFAWGPDMADIAGKAAAVIVRAQATRLDVSSEEGAAYIILGITGTNGVQAFRAYTDEKRKKEEQKTHAERAAAAIRVQHQHVNGVAPGAAEQRRAEEQQAATKRADQGPVV